MKTEDYRFHGRIVAPPYVKMARWPMLEVAREW
jgi:hypothetical protein